MIKKLKDNLLGTKRREKSVIESMIGYHVSNPSILWANGFAVCLAILDVFVCLE